MRGENRAQRALILHGWGKCAIYARIYFYAISNDLRQKFIVEFSKFNWDGNPGKR